MLKKSVVLKLKVVSAPTVETAMSLMPVFTENYQPLTVTVPATVDNSSVYGLAGRNEYT